MKIVVDGSLCRNQHFLVPIEDRIMITRRLVLNIEEEEYFPGYLIAENEVVGRHFDLHIHPLLF